MDSKNLAIVLIALLLWSVFVAGTTWILTDQSAHIQAQKCATQINKPDTGGE